MYRLTLVGIYPSGTICAYLLSTYFLKAYLKKVFKENVLSVEILNFDQRAAASSIVEVIEQTKPDCVGYSCYVWNINLIEEIIKKLRDNDGICHVLGGPEISLNRARQLHELSLGDYYVIGEGEKKFASLIAFLSEKTDKIGQCPPAGVVYFNEKNICYEQDTQPMNLSEVPSVYLTGAIDSSLYERKQAFLETQRGCRNKCKYCVYHKGLPKISYYPLEQTFQELDHLIIAKQVFALRFIDPLFTSDLARAKAIVDYLMILKAVRGVRLPWIYWEFTYDRLDEEFLKMISLLKYGEHIRNSYVLEPLDRPQHYSDLLQGYTAVNCFGIQSFNQTALKAVRRMNVKRQKLEWLMTKAREYNIVLKIDLILGLPFETLKSYFDGLDYILPSFIETDHILNIHRLQMLPGSDLESQSHEYQLEYLARAPNLVISTNKMSAEEMIFASQITCLLFRILNSPLRPYLFEAQLRKNLNYCEIICQILNKLKTKYYLYSSRLFTDQHVDDSYWNTEAYTELSSDMLKDCLKNL